MKAIIFCLVLASLSLQIVASDYCQAERNTTDEVQRVQHLARQHFKLVQVQVLTRHGDRAPVYYIPPHIYNDTAIWDCKINRLSHFEDTRNGGQNANYTRLTRERFMPGRQANRGNCGLGSLTQQGVDQHILTGRKFKKMYIDAAALLSPEWNSQEMYFRSGNQLRLVESAQSILLGMYSNAGKNESQNVDLIDNDFDNMTPDVLTNCPKGQRIRQAMEATDYYQHHMNKYNSLSARLADIFNTSIPVSDMNDLILSRSCHGFDITFGGLLNQTMIKEINDTALFHFTFFPNSTESNRLAMGTFLEEMIEYTHTPYKFLLFSGHDSSVWPLLNTLNIYDRTWPPLASHVVFEFWERDGRRYIEIIYNGKVLTHKVPGCGGRNMCDWSDFLSTTEPVRMSYDQWWQECREF